MAKEEYESLDEESQATMTRDLQRTFLSIYQGQGLPVPGTALPYLVESTFPTPTVKFWQASKNLKYLAITEYVRFQDQAMAVYTQLAQGGLAPWSGSYQRQNAEATEHQKQRRTELLKEIGAHPCMIYPEAPLEVVVPPSLERCAGCDLLRHSLGSFGGYCCLCCYKQHTGITCNWWHGHNCERRVAPDRADIPKAQPIAPLGRKAGQADDPTWTNWDPGHLKGILSKLRLPDRNAIMCVLYQSTEWDYSKRHQGTAELIKAELGEWAETRYALLADIYSTPQYIDKASGDEWKSLCYHVHSDDLKRAFGALARVASSPE